MRNTVIRGIKGAGNVKDPHDNREVVTRLIIVCVSGGGGIGLRRWSDPERRCTRTPDSGSGHTPARGKAKRAGLRKFGGLY